jgi:tRNA (guanine-N7-)-methyltransferase
VSTATPEAQRPIRSFVLRQGRLTRGQERALTRLWPRYGVAPTDILDLAALFGRTAPVWLEIGFGHGEALRHMAARHPEIDFLGLEVHRPGVGHLLNGLEADGLTNVRVLRADAAEVLQACMPAAGLARVLVFFPDPWPKKRHHKRRLIQPGFADALAAVLAPGGHLHLATDWGDYAEHMRAVLDPHAAFINTAEGWAERPAYRPETRFEQRGTDKGHAVYDLLYRRR